MICPFCQEDVRGTPCQTASQASGCPNNRADDWPDDHMSASQQAQSDSKDDTKKEIAKQ